MLRAVVSGAVVAAALAAATARAADPLPLSELARPGRVLMLRHAYAPGTGDPPNFNLRDCSTQRNLDATGREQAEDLGELLAETRRKAGIAYVKVYSSQWCRCLETARLLNLGPVEELHALNSFYDRPQDRRPNIAELRAFFAKLPAGGPPVILVTHQVTINAIVGRGAVSGGGAILEVNGSGSPRVLGAIEPN